MARTTFVLNRLGVRQLARGEELRGYLKTRADAAAMLAGGAVPHIETGRMEMVTLSEISAQRARAVVIANHPAADAIEAKYRWLTRAVEAAGLEAAGLEVHDEPPRAVGRRTKRLPSNAVAEHRRRAQDAKNARGGDRSARRRRRTG